MNEKLLCLILTIALIIVVTWNLFVLNYLHFASKKQETLEKFESMCHISMTSIKIGRIVSIVILIFSFLLLFSLSRKIV